MNGKIVGFTVLFVVIVVSLFSLQPFRRGRAEQPSLLVGTNAWPGYEPFYLARSLSYFDERSIRLVECTSASQVITAFRNHTRVFRNLFENSLQACSAEPRVWIDCAKTQLSGKDALRISVRDNGAGFANGDAKRVFEPLFSTKSHGTGLGMAIVKRTIEAHGGSIAVGQDQQRGAEIVIKLPKSGD